MRVKDVELYRPYRIPDDKDNKSFVLFVNKDKEPIVLEHNHRISSMYMHRWKATYNSTSPLTTKWEYIIDKEIDFIPFTNYRYLIQSLFESTHKTFEVKD